MSVSYYPLSQYVGFLKTYFVLILATRSGSLGSGDWLLWKLRDERVKTVIKDSALLLLIRNLMLLLLTVQ